MRAARARADLILRLGEAMAASGHAIDPETTAATAREFADALIAEAMGTPKESHRVPLEGSVG